MTFIHAFQFIGDNAGLLWHKSLEHMAISAVAVGIALAIALPIGLWLGHLHRGSFLAVNTANIGRALPSLAVLAIGLSFLGIGKLNVVVALVILAVPPILTNAYVAVDEVDTDAVEAARGMGMKPRELFAKVELPLAVPLTFAGIRTAAVYVVATATLAGFFGGGGLGDIISNQASYGLDGVVGAAIVVTVLALGTDLLLALAQRLITPRGLRADDNEIFGAAEEYELTRTAAETA
ncbi:MAG TPA: ABC transporter permease [Thermoleophilaceae bacterium]